MRIAKSVSKVFFIFTPIAYAYLDVSENSGFSPQIIHSNRFNRVFHGFSIHFGVALFFGNTHLRNISISTDSSNWVEVVECEVPLR